MGCFGQWSWCPFPQCPGGEDMEIRCYNAEQSKEEVENGY